MSDFSIRRDWKNIDWKITLQYNVFRSLCATPVWLLLFFLSSKHFVWQMLLFPVIYFAFWLPLGFITGWLARIGIPVIGILSIVCSLVIVVGDPVVWIISKIKPDLVPVDCPKFLDFHLIVFVVKNPEAIPLCTFEGRIITDDNVQFLGEAFPLRKTLFIIKPDWSVETLKDANFGFVDIEGAIKKGRLQKGIDPRETNIGEMVAYIGNDGVCYNPQQQRLGQYDTMPESEYTSDGGNGEMIYSEENNKQLLERLDQISGARKLKRTDFPSWYKTCPFAGHIEAINEFKFLNTDWSRNEIIFDIDYRGYVKTPYDDFFGYIEENGDIMKDGVEDEESVKIASVKGQFCYADNLKIGKFIVQTD
jgi:hypothetical protein